MRTGWDDITNTINMIDPEGGPCFTVGSKIEKYTICKIVRDGSKLFFEMKK
jgi:hypothetical protein